MRFIGKKKLWGLYASFKNITKIKNKVNKFKKIHYQKKQQKMKSNKNQNKKMKK
jgi:hypothetical protein